MARSKPERTGDLAAAILASDRSAVAALAAVAVLVGVAIVAAASVRKLQAAHRAERAEWAFQCDQLETERDVARARFTVDSRGDVDDGGSDA